MTETLPVPRPVDGPGFPRLALGLAWLGTALGAGAVGWAVDGFPGGLLIGAAVLGLVALGAVASNRRRHVTLAFSVLASAVMIAAGVAAATLAVIDGGLQTGETVALGAVPIVGGLLSWLLSRRAQRMAESL